MSELRQSVDDYLQVRRSLGYKLTIHGGVLPQFVEFLEQRDALVITTSLALEFATQPQNTSVVWWHQRLAIVSGFALYLRAFDPRTEVPPADLLPAKFGRAIHNSTAERWETAGRPPPGSRPGEGQVIAHFATGEPILRYSPAPPLVGTTGEIEALSLWAGQSVALAKQPQPAAEIVAQLVSRF